MLDGAALAFHHLRMSFRIYIDESGDHVFHDSPNPPPRYLGLTAVVFRKAEYDPSVPQALELLKREHFAYDVDDPPVLVRKQILDRKSHFGVLREAHLNAMWETGLLKFLAFVPMHVATVVFDKKDVGDAIRQGAVEPYNRCLGELLNVVGRWLTEQRDGMADVMVEGRGKKENNDLQEFYLRLRETGINELKADLFKTLMPKESLLFGKKQNNIAGLQVADIIAAEQKILAVQEAQGPKAYPIGTYGQRINEAISYKLVPDGRKLLQE